MKRGFLSIFIAIALLTACFGAVGHAAPVGAPIVLTAAISDNTKVEDYNKNEVTLYLEQTLGVDIQYNVYASTDYADKMQLKVAGGDKLEDFIFGGFSDVQVYNWAQEGAITGLKELYASEQTAPNIYQAMERVGYDFRGSITMPDGEIYYIPTLNQSYGNECSAKVWYYEPWLTQLDISAPTTTAEFEELLKKIKTSDLNGNGVSDEVGLAGYGGIGGQWFNYLMNSFVYTDSSNMYMKVSDKELSFSFTETAWRDGIEWIASLVKEGLIPTETITQDNAAFQTMINTSDVTAFTFGFSTPSPITDVGVKSVYKALAPLIGPNQVQYATVNPSKASCAMIISADCEHVAAAFSVGDLMVSEELSIATRFGARYADWDYLSDLDNASDYISPYPGFDAYIVVYNDATFWGSGAPQNRSYMQNGPFIRQYGIANGMGINPATVSPFSVNEATGISLYQQGGYFPDEKIVKLIYTEDEASVIQSLSSTISTFVSETNANWLLGNTLLDDASWDQFLNTIDSIGAYDYLKCAQDAYNRSIQ
ncbi:hypothetical protein AGMMS49992_19050 [Clostridia bacterium]|nr:hypothetical protein AGMMS49992_19050 [Clostridia bacterium]